MSLEFRQRPASVLAGLLAAGLMITVAACGLTPLGPDAAATAPPPSPLRSPIVLQAMSVQPPAPAGGCPARFTMISVPGNPGECVRPLDSPVTITSAAVSAVSPTSMNPATSAHAPAGQSFLRVKTMRPSGECASTRTTGSA